VVEAFGYLNDAYEQFHALHDADSNEIGFLKGTFAMLLANQVTLP